jgi:hypothetical protein
VTEKVAKQLGIGPESVRQRWIPPLEGAGLVVCHDSMILQGMESPPKSVRFSFPSLSDSALRVPKWRHQQNRLSHTLSGSAFGAVCPISDLSLT